VFCDKSGISIVVATKGRVQLLGELLQSIYRARQKYQGESETIIVDDSNEKDSQEIKVLCNKYDAKMTFFTPSVAGKRNHGAKLAKYNIILFLDSDCIATENLLEEQYFKMSSIATPESSEVAPIFLKTVIYHKDKRTFKQDKVVFDSRKNLNLFFLILHFLNGKTCND
jgi:glycosyltransferase involved in cell wall biosynthesis